MSDKTMPDSTKQVALPAGQVVNLSTTLSFEDGEQYVMQNKVKGTTVRYADVSTSDPDPTTATEDCLTLDYGEQPPLLIVEDGKQFFAWMAAGSGKVGITPG